MKMKALNIALKLYEIAGPIFVSLKEEIKPAIAGAPSHQDIKKLTFTQLRILLAVEYGKNQVGKLARSAQVAQPAMSKIVDRLIRLNFLRRAPHPSDRRQIKLSLTPKGTAMTRRIRLRAAEKYVEAIQGLSLEEQRRLLDGITIVFEIIQKTRNQEI